MQPLEAVAEEGYDFLGGSVRFVIRVKATSRFH